MPKKKPVTATTAPKQPRAPRKTYPHVTAERLCQVWTESPDIATVMEATELPRSAITARVASYRKLGVNLKKMGRGAKKIDVAGLNKMIASLAAK